MVIPRVFTDEDLDKNLTDNKIVLGEWYGFEFFLDKELKVYPLAKIDKDFKTKGVYTVGQIQFAGNQNKLTQINLKAIEHLHCIDQESFEVIKSFFHIKVRASKLRSSSIVGILNRNLSCKNP